VLFCSSVWPHRSASLKLRTANVIGSSPQGLRPGPRRPSDLACRAKTLGN
jgi:hypothetical protein